MEKKSKRNRNILKTLSMGMVVIFSCCLLTACVGAMGGPGTISSGTGGYKPPEFENPYAGASDKLVQDYNDVFLGAIGVYETDNNSKVFYDNYTNQFVDFNTLIDRQFEALATAIFQSIKDFYGTGTVDARIDGYGTTGIFAPRTLVDTTIYNDSGTLMFKNSASGGYKLNMTESTDEEGNPVYTFAYSEAEIVSSRAWKNVSIIDIYQSLKYIYKNPFKLTSIPNNFYIVSNSDTNTNLKQLKNYYINFNAQLNNNDSIDTIGFSKEYMWNVLYYIAFSIIGETNINNSIDSASIVFNGSILNSITKDNYLSFEKYKGYEKILPELVSSIFKLRLYKGSIIDIKVGEYYCFDTTNYNLFYDNTLFPILERNEYIFFDDLNDICDAEEPSNSFDSDYDFDNAKTEEELENEVIKVGSLRKLKKIVLIPKIDSTKYKYETFNVGSLSVCFTTQSGEIELEILTNLTDENGKKYENQQLKFDDGSYSFGTGDGTTVSGSGSNSMVTKNNHLIVQSTPSVNKYGNFASIFESEEEAEEYKFSSVSDSAKITNSFQSTSYDVATTSEKINIGRLKVCNQLFKMEKVDSSEKSSGVSTSIQTDNNNYNIIEFDFKYYNKGGSEMTSIPNLYMLEFGLL